MNRSRPARARRPFVLAWCLLAAGLLGGLPAGAAGDEPEPIQLDGVIPGGLRMFVTDSWGTFDFSLKNATDVDRKVRVVVFYEGRSDVQYGRDVWVPARSTLSTWMLVGPPLGEHRPMRCDLEVLLYDRTGEEERLLLPTGQLRIRDRAVVYRRREAFTLVYVNEEAPEQSPFGRLPEPESAADQAVHLARSARQAAGLSELVHRTYFPSLPHTDQAFDPIDRLAQVPGKVAADAADVVIIASGELAHNPAGMRSLRQWLEGGGRLWVMLDMVEPDVLAPLLGGALDFQVVDRVALTQFRLESSSAISGVTAPLQQHERPVDFVRVLLPPHEHVRHTVNGWPAWFTRSVGHGQVVFTTLGPRGWYRPWRPGDPTPFLHHPYSPVPSDALAVVAEQAHRRVPGEDPYGTELLRPLLEPEIGYSVIGPGTVALVFAAFVAGALGLGLVLRRSRRPELVGWLGPVAALGAAGVFLALAEVSRRAAPATVAVVQVVEAVPGTEEAAVHGLLALYRPDSGPIEVGAEQGGFFELDMEGLKGQTHRLTLTDLDAWHWDDLNLPAGVRFAPFHYTAPLAEPLSAVAHLGPHGLEGKLTAGAFRDPGDAILSGRGTGRDMAVRLRTDGTFSAAAADALAPGDYLTGAVLSDQQQRRQTFYREVLKRSRNPRREGPPVLMAWAEPVDMHFALGSGARTVGQSLLVVPLRLTHAPAGEHVTIPGPLVTYARLLDGRPIRVPPESTSSAEMRLRFQLPPAALPLKVERARLLARIDAPGRRVTVSGRADGQAAEVYHVDSPLDPIRAEVADERFLRPDEDGGLHLDVSVSEPGAGKRAGSPGGDKWTIEYLELEVIGVSQ